MLLKNHRVIHQLSMYRALMIWYGKREGNNVNPNVNLNISQNLVTKLSRHEPPACSIQPCSNGTILCSPTGNLIGQIRYHNYMPRDFSTMRDDSVAEANCVLGDRPKYDAQVTLHSGRYGIEVLIESLSNT